MNDGPATLDIWHTTLPMRTFEHAAATRQATEAIVVRLRTPDGHVGWGETLPRPYVTGETLESVPADIREIFWPRLRACRDRREFQAALAELPCRDGDRVVTAARCAVELAATDALNLWPPSPIETSPTRRPPLAPARVSGVIGSADPKRTARSLRRMRLYGLKHFKLKLGFDQDVDRANLDAVTKQLARNLRAGKCSLRVDANGAWPYGEVPGRIDELKARGVLAVEQPCRAGAGRLAELASKCSLPLIADESCLTELDAEVLLGAEGRVWLNLRLAKNGGLGPTLAIARQAARDEVPWVLGCMVGESSILSTAQRALLAAGPPPAMLEGNYGKFLLKDDLAAPSLRFGYGGRVVTTPGGRFSPPVLPEKITRYGRWIATLD